MRYFIRFSYFGKHYHGWQKQPNAVTVQGVLEDALSKLLANEIILMGAGRTDAGVHAKELYAHFDFEEIPKEVLGRLPWRTNPQKKFGFISCTGIKKPSFKFISK